ncbi:MAG: penicillin-binding protein activator [Planktotalea sp.]|uniref:penicillin-binding protein activator n=1 Tax=Planktotalea sp. TaxID=2029877 RepID=UPI003C786F43
MFAFLSSARKVLTRSVFASVIVALAACQPITLGGGTGLGGGAGPTINTSEPVPVALLIPKSSNGAGTVATSLENAARMAIADLTNVKIDLRVYDTAGSTTQAAAMAQKAVADGAQIILGPLFADAANAAGVAVANQNVNILSFSNNSSIAGGNVFVLGPTFENTAERLMNFAARQGKTKVLIAHPNNVEGQFGRNAVQQAASRNGIAVASVNGFEFSQAGVVAAIPQIKAAMDSTGADSLVMTSNSAGALPMLAQMLPEAGVNPANTQYIGLARWDVPAQTLELPGLQNGWFALPDQAMIQNFQTRYTQAYGSSPHQLAGLAYDGIAAIGALVEAGNKKALTAGALTQGAGFQGVAGAFRLRPNGTNERALSVAMVRNKQVVIIDPAPTKFTGAGF